MGFILILMLTTLSIAGSAAFFSIYGLAQIFTGSFLPVVIMAGSLEAGKLVSASYIYRYWKRISWLLKAYLISAVVILMVITSAGIFGFLSAAYQQDTLPLKQNEQKITLLENERKEITQLKQERLDRKKQIDKDIANLPNTYITARQRLMKSYGPELDQLKEDIANYTNRMKEIIKEKHKLKTATLEQRVHTGPIIFIAKELFHDDVDEATKWLIFILIFAFDPLAVALTIATNQAFIDRNNEKGKKIGHISFQPEPIEMDIADYKSINNKMSIEELEEMLDKLNSSKEKSAENKIQKALIEEMLEKKKVTKKLRNPKNT